MKIKISGQLWQATPTSAFRHLEAAEAVCSGQPVLASEQMIDLLGRLVDRSLVASFGGPHERRFRLLETIRQYAAERLTDANEAEAVRRRHLDWCLSVAEAAPTDVFPNADQWASVVLEHDNLRAALRFALDRGQTHAETGLRLGAALGSSASGLPRGNIARAPPGW